MLQPRVTYSQSSPHIVIKLVLIKTKTLVFAVNYWMVFKTEMIKNDIQKVQNTTRSLRKQIKILLLYLKIWTFLLVLVYLTKRLAFWITIPTPPNVNIRFSTFCYIFLALLRYFLLIILNMSIYGFRGKI